MKISYEGLKRCPENIVAHENITAKNAMFWNIPNGEIHCALAENDKSHKSFTPTVGCVIRTKGVIRDYVYNVDVVLSKKDIRTIAKSFLEIKDLVSILKKKCGDMTLSELMK